MKDKNEKLKEEDRKNDQSLKEQAINKTTQDGEDINHQVKERREKHLPRDTA